VFSLVGTGFVAANFKATINGYMYGNMPMLTMKKGERVRWYVVSIGEGTNFHTPHWYGNVVLDGGKRTDTIFISPAQMLTVDRVPDIPASGCFTATSMTTWTRAWWLCTKQSHKPGQQGLRERLRKTNKAASGKQLPAWFRLASEIRR
jgi:hypothetical protein